MRGALAVLLALVPCLAFAQETPALRAHHFTFDAAAAWSGGYDIGQASAVLRGNGLGPTPPSFVYFRTESRVRPSIAPQVRAQFALTERLAIEVAAAFARPRIGVRIAGDAEAPTQQLPGEALHQYTISAGVTWQVPMAMGARLAPFVAAGGGHLRQLHEDRTLAETGQGYYAGLGVRYWLSGGRRSRTLGLRADARVNLRRKGIDFEDQARTFPTFSLALFVGL